MKYAYSRLLIDDELRTHLAHGDTLVFNGLAPAWRQLELQVERIGFGDTYAVLRSKRSALPGEQEVLKVSPLRTPPES